MSQMMSNVPAMLPMTMPAIAPPERLLGHVSDVEVVDCRDCRVMGAYSVMFLAQSPCCMVLVRMLPTEWWDRTYHGCRRLYKIISIEDFDTCRFCSVQGLIDP